VLLASVDGYGLYWWGVIVRLREPSVHNLLEKSRFESMSSVNPQSIPVISRRELLKRGGKGAAAAAVSSVFLPFAFTGKAAAPKTLSFWQFYAPAKQSDIPKTWDQFLEIAHKLTKGQRFGCLFETGPGYYQTFTWYPFMWQGGGEIATPDGKRSAIASPATVQALEFWQNAIQQNVAPRNNDGGDVIANLVSGFCAMQNLGTWGVSAMREFAKDFQYGVFPLPLPPNGQQRNIFGGWAFVANAKGKNPEEAAKFCVWAVGSMQDDSIQRVVDWCTKANSHVSPRNRLWKKEPPKEGTTAPR
jgi:hypothetical protein